MGNLLTSVLAAPILAQSTFSVAAVEATDAMGPTTRALIEAAYETGGVANPLAKIPSGWLATSPFAPREKTLELVREVLASGTLRNSLRQSHLAIREDDFGISPPPQGRDFTMRVESGSVSGTAAVPYHLKPDEIGLNGEIVRRPSSVEALIALMWKDLSKVSELHGEKGKKETGPSRRLTLFEINFPNGAGLRIWEGGSRTVGSDQIDVDLWIYINGGSKKDRTRALSQFTTRLSPTEQQESFWLGTIYRETLGEKSLQLMVGRLEKINFLNIGQIPLGIPLYPWIVTFINAHAEILGF